MCAPSASVLARERAQRYSVHPLPRTIANEDKIEGDHRHREGPRSSTNGGCPPFWGLAIYGSSLQPS